MFEPNPTHGWTQTMAISVRNTWGQVRAGQFLAVYRCEPRTEWRARANLSHTVKIFIRSPSGRGDVTVMNYSTYFDWEGGWLASLLFQSWVQPDKRGRSVTPSSHQSERPPAKKLTYTVSETYVKLALITSCPITNVENWTNIYSTVALVVSISNIASTVV